MRAGIINQKAIDLLDQAAFTSSAVKDKERKSGSVKDERLSDVVDWSLTRHKTWKWPVIGVAGLIILLEVAFGLPVKLAEDKQDKLAD